VFNEAQGDISQLFVLKLESMKLIQLTYDTTRKRYPVYSPNGVYVAYIDEDSETTRVCTISRPENHRDVIHEFSKCIIRDLAWSPDSQTLTLSINHNGSFVLVNLELTTGEVTHLTDDQLMNIDPKWSPDGQYILYRAESQERDSVSKLILMRMADQRAKVILELEKRIISTSWSSDCSKIVISAMFSRSMSKMGVLYPINNHLDWLTIEHDRVRMPLWSPDGKKLAFVVDISVNARIGILDIASREVCLCGPEDGLCADLQYTRDGKAIVFSHQGPLNPSELWYLDLVSGAFSRLTNGLPVEIDRDDLVSPQQVTYTSFDGTEIPALLYKPKHLNNNRVPAIIRIHGGPNWITFNNLQPEIQHFVDLGYIVIAPNFRGSIGYGSDFEDLSKNDWGGGDVQDIIAAAKYLINSKLAVPGSIALWGGSYGGYLVLMSLIGSPETWLAGIELYGFVDLVHLYRNSEKWFQDWMQNQIGSPDDRATFYKERSPINSIERIKTPLLVIHGSNDGRVPASQTKMLKEVLDLHGKQYSVQLYQNEGHIFSDIDTKIDCVHTIETFLQDCRNRLCDKPQL
jgi:dipeptidyl aminopeptidase/acylaminoacyl peptidase